jgi:hypothetical protein
VPVAAPAASKGGVLRLHLARLEKYGQKWNDRIEAVEVNVQPLALATEASVKRTIVSQGVAYDQTVTTDGNLRIPDVLDIPLAAGEVKLLSLRTLPMAGEHYGRLGKDTTRVSLEWVEGQPGQQADATPAPVLFASHPQHGTFAP